MRLFFGGVLEFSVIELGHFGFDPGFEQLLITAARNTFQNQNAQSGSGRTSTPPFGSSAVKLVTLDRDRTHSRIRSSCTFLVLVSLLEYLAAVAIERGQLYG